MYVWRLIRSVIPYALVLAVIGGVSFVVALTVGTWMMRRAEGGPVPAPPGRVIQVGGHAVHVTEHGDGPAIVLLHGVPGSSTDWPDALAGRLRAAHRVIAIDLLGFGWSGRPATVGMDVWGVQVAEAMDALGVQRATIVGHDAGAAAAVATARRSPDAVSRLVLVALAVPIEQESLSWRAFLPLVPGTGEVMAGWSPRLLLPASAPVAVASGPWWVVPGTRRCTLTALRDGVPASDLRGALKEVRAPTLVLHGTADDVVPWRVAARWVPSIDGVLIRLLEGGGHWLPQARPAEVADAVLAFEQKEVDP